MDLFWELLAGLERAERKLDMSTIAGCWPDGCGVVLAQTGTFGIFLKLTVPTWLGMCHVDVSRVMNCCLLVLRLLGMHVWCVRCRDTERHSGTAVQRRLMAGAYVYLYTVCVGENVLCQLAVIGCWS